jgi:hypothetical protein
MAGTCGGTQDGVRNRDSFAQMRPWKGFTFVLVMALASCGDDGSEAQRRGVGSQCASNAECTEKGQSCLLQFKGGYCGIAACTKDADCPAGSACVRHDDGMTYCFLVCSSKPECNRNRAAELEANCSSTAVLVDAPKDRKVCSPPSGS